MWCCYYKADTNKSKFLIFTNFTGSLHNNNQHIEPELLKTVQHYSILDELSASCDENQHLSTCLPYIAFKKSIGSLAAHKDFELMKYSEFLSISKNVTERQKQGQNHFRVYL